MLLPNYFVLYVHQGGEGGRNARIPEGRRGEGRS